MGKLNLAIKKLIFLASPPVQVKFRSDVAELTRLANLIRWGDGETNLLFFGKNPHQSSSLSLCFNLWILLISGLIASEKDRNFIFAIPRVAFSDKTFLLRSGLYRYWWLTRFVLGAISLLNARHNSFFDSHLFYARPLPDPNGLVGRTIRLGELIDKKDVVKFVGDFPSHDRYTRLGLPLCCFVALPSTNSYSNLENLKTYISGEDPDCQNPGVQHRVLVAAGPAGKIAIYQLALAGKIGLIDVGQFSV